MKIIIKNYWSGSTVYECEAESIREACEKAAAEGRHLRGADLRDAVLCDADLSGAVLRGAVLRRADLRGADLSGADLRGADLSGAVLRGAILSDADLSGAVLRRADLRGADLRGADIPIVANIHSVVYESAARPGALNMASWHTCNTTHCRGGWVVFHAGEAGAKLEENIGTPAAAALIYFASDPKMERVPDFYASNEDALADMKAMAEAETAK